MAWRHSSIFSQTIWPRCWHPWKRRLLGLAHMIGESWELFDTLPGELLLTRFFGGRGANADLGFPDWYLFLGLFGATDVALTLSLAKRGGVKNDASAWSSAAAAWTRRRSPGNRWWLAEFGVDMLFANQMRRTEAMEVRCWCLSMIQISTKKIINQLVEAFINNKSRAVRCKNRLVGPLHVSSTIGAHVDSRRSAYWFFDTKTSCDTTTIPPHYLAYKSVAPR